MKTDSFNPSLERSYRFRLSAELFQFFIADVWAEVELAWDERTLDELYTLSRGAVGIGTNCEGLVSVEVELWNSYPWFDAQLWDHVVECGIDVPSGKIAIASYYDVFYEDAFLITLRPGNYRARICYGNQYECGDEDPTCTGRYKIMLWPSKESAARVIKTSVDLFVLEVC